jgi:hypothetical protein
MKYLMVIALLFTTQSFAEDSTMKSVDLDVNTTYLIKADLDLNGYYYYIDKTACICWLGSSSGSNPMIRVPCKKLNEHALLTPYVVHCKD